jgi:hypothetical protein
MEKPIVFNVLCFIEAGGAVKAGAKGKYCRLVLGLLSCLYVFMKIDGPNKTSGPKNVSKPGARKESGDGAFDAMIGESAETEPQAPVSRTASISALDALLVLQGAEGGTSEEASKKAKKRAADLLDHLDNVRTGLLTGELPQSVLRQLSYTIASHREAAIDPKLAEILDEIDLRAQVELAKLG